MDVYGGYIHVYLGFMDVYGCLFCKFNGIRYTLW